MVSYYYIELYKYPKTQQILLKTKLTNVVVYLGTLH